MTREEARKAYKKGTWLCYSSIWGHHVHPVRLVRVSQVDHIQYGTILVKSEEHGNIVLRIEHLYVATAKDLLELADD